MYVLGVLEIGELLLVAVISRRRPFHTAQALLAKLWDTRPGQLLISLSALLV